MYLNNWQMLPLFSSLSSLTKENCNIIRHLTFSIFENYVFFCFVFTSPQSIYIFLVVGSTKVVWTSFTLGCNVFVIHYSNALSNEMEKKGTSKGGSIGSMLAFRPRDPNSNPAWGKLVCQIFRTNWTSIKPEHQQDWCIK